MNFDLLKKLTRLANNNPNENEANLAARKVAKMLQEGDWSLPSNNGSSTEVKREPTINTYEDRRTGDYHIKISRLDLDAYPTT